jgi:exopolyphosphatase/guanosine-5'-triphosphate,3'-diphosphate pyrophosphatase
MGIRLAAIDVGSNAVRFELGELVDKKQIQVIHNYRVPIRLGDDSFSKGKISDKTMHSVIKAFIEFQKLMIQYDVKYYKAVATSALRDATNKEVLVDLIYSTSHIQLDIIDGKEEARLVHLSVSHVENISKKNSLLIDIGGGSVEFVISINGKIKNFYSLNMGTIRLLHKAKKNKAKDLRKFLYSEVRKNLRPILKYKKYFNKPHDKKVFVGTGGNIKSLNKLAEMFDRHGKHEISHFQIEVLEKIISSYSIPERIEKLGLKPDRADVILPAAIIILEIMKAMDFKKMKAPNVGVKDGILIQLAKF